MLDAHGPANFAKMSDATVWKPISGRSLCAQCITELSSKNVYQRGEGLNRMLQTVILFCHHQQDPKVKEHNEAVLKETMFKEVYDEIDRVLPSLEY